MTMLVPDRMTATLSRGAAGIEPAATEATRAATRAPSAADDAADLPAYLLTGRALARRMCASIRRHHAARSRSSTRASSRTGSVGACRVVATAADESRRLLGQASCGTQEEAVPCRCRARECRAGSCKDERGTSRRLFTREHVTVPRRRACQPRAADCSHRPHWPPPVRRCLLRAQSAQPRTLPSGTRGPHRGLIMGRSATPSG